jgi:hypothetical protein
MLSLNFIAEHELSHILFGHVDYLRHSYGLELTNELFQKKKLDNIDTQTLEIDADSTALARLVGMLLRALSKDDESQDLYSLIFDVNFALCNLFWLFGADLTTPPSVYAGTHPHPFVRQLGIGALFTTMFDTWKVEHDAGKVGRTVWNGITEAIKAYRSLTGLNGNLEVYREMGRTPNLDKWYTGKLLKHWKDNLREKLVPFTYRPLAD